MGAGLDNGIRGLAPKLSSLGRMISVGISLPLALVGKKAASSFLEFERSLTDIEALVGVNKETVEGWGQELLDTAPKMGIMAKEAASALYYINSSGVEAADAMDVLNDSMKASAVGLGETNTLANVSTSVMNAYGKEVINSAQALDVLLVAVAEGKAEPEEFARSISAVIPLASELGISFDQVAATMATMSISGTSASQSATQLRQIMTNLIRPSHQAKQGLHQVGLSTETVHESLRKDGLLATLDMLKVAFGDNVQAMSMVFDDVRGLTGVYNLLGEKADKAVEIQNKVANATGAVGKAMEIVGETKAHKLNQALAELDSSMIVIGANVVPMVSTIVTGVAKIAEGFAALPEPIRATAIGLGAVAVLTGPLLYGLSGIATAAHGVGVAFAWVKVQVAAANMAMLGGGGLKGLAMGALAATGPLIAVAATVAVLGFAWKKASDRANEAVASFKAAADAANRKIETSELATGFDDALTQIDKYNAAIATANAEQDKIASKPLLSFQDKEDIEAWVEIGRTAQENASQIAKMRGQALAVANEFGVSAEVAWDWVMAQKATGMEFKDGKAAIDAYKASLGQTKPAAQATASTLQTLMQNAKGATDAFFGVTNATRGFEDAQKRVTDAARGEESARRSLDQVRREEATSAQRVTDAQRRIQEASRNTTDAVRRQSEAQQKLNDLMNGLSPDEQLSIDSAQLSLEEAQKRVNELGQDGPVDPLDQRRALLDLRRAQLDFERAQGEHGRAVAAAREDLANANEAVASAKAAEVDAHNAFRAAQQEHAEYAFRIRDAEIAVADAQREHQRAAEDLLPAAHALAESQAGFAAALAGSNNEAQPFIDYLIKLKETYGDLVPGIDQAIAKFQELKDVADANSPTNVANYTDAQAIDKALSLSPVLSPNITGDQARQWLINNSHRRASGGPLGAGQLAMVNERGTPELFTDGKNQYLIPTNSGRVVPLEGGGIQGTAASGPSVQFGDIIINEARDGHDAADALRRKARAKIFLAGGR